ncbi:hypothetical protein HYS91_00400 [Candidatus Daviesbacteria bacterium]|nr:hypothetical protein [Candidatus Daviesbacteria bacterium]
MEQTAPVKSNSNLGWIVGIVLTLAALALGFFMGRGLLATNPGSINNQASGSATMVKTSPLFKAQTATIQGKITKIDGSTITVTSQDNQAETFPLDSNFTIYKHTSGTSFAAALPGSDKQIELNKDSIIVLNVKDGDYKVSSISYLSPPPKPPGR